MEGVLSVDSPAKMIALLISITDNEQQECVTAMLQFAVLLFAVPVCRIVTAKALEKMK